MAPTTAGIRSLVFTSIRIMFDCEGSGFLKLGDTDGLTQLRRRVHAIYDYVSFAETKFFDVDGIY
jgi:hypothetical protein